MARSTTTTPSLADAFADGPEPTLKGPRCTVGQILTAADEAGAASLRQALADTAWTSARIAERLRATGRRVSGQAITRHRRGECLCSTLGIA